VSVNPTRAPDDPGAFAVFNAQDIRNLDGAAYVLTARIARQSRLAHQWDTWMLERIHYELFGDLFPGRAGQLRQSEVTFRAHSIPRRVRYFTVSMMYV
jgi:fido (protein-threonine AMPylation protein)